MRLIEPGGQSATLSGDAASMVKAIARGQRWWQQLCSQSITMAALAAQEGVTPSYVSRVTRLAFLDPTIIRAILDGRAPADLTARKLLLPTMFPARWSDQRRMFGFETR